MARIIVRPFHVLALDAHTYDFVAGSVMSIRNYFRPSNGLSESMGSISVALKSRAGNFKSALCQVSWIFPAPCYCTFYSTSPSQEQRTHPRYLSRQMSYDSSFFTATAYWSEAFLGLSFAQWLSNRRLPYFFIYMVASNTAFPFEKLFHDSYFLRTFLPPALAWLPLHARAAQKPITLLQTLCC